MAKSKIIKDLANGKTPVEYALKQLKVILYEFNKQGNLEWVNHELEGYKEIDTLPKYRKTYGCLLGNLISHNLFCTSVGISLKEDTPEEVLKYCSEVDLYDSISALRIILNSNEEISKQVSPNYLPTIQHYSAIKMDILLNAAVIISKVHIQDVFAHVENKVLNALLLLEKEFGNLDELDLDISSKSNEEIAKIENNIYLIFYKDDSISLGNNNKLDNSTLSTGE